MSVASFQIDQVRPSGTSHGTADVARNDLWLDRQINLVSLASGSHRYLWSFLDAPAGSSWGPSTPPLNSTMQTANFTPDVLGSYRIQLLVDNSVSEIMVAAVRYDDLGTLQNRGWCYPALGEEVGEDNFHGSTRGWNAILDGIFDDILNFIQGGSAGGVSVQQDGTALPSNPYSTMNFTGAGVSASDVGGIATVNIPGGGGIVAPVVLTGSQSLAIPSVATTYVTDISDGQTSEFHLTGTPADGLSLTFVDSQDTYNWGNNPLVLHPQGGSSPTPVSGLVGVPPPGPSPTPPGPPRVFIQDPVTLTYYSMGMPVTVSVAGASVTWEWSSAESTWYVTSASLGMSGYALPLYLTFAQSGTSIACSGSTQLVFLDQSGGAGTYSLPVSPMDGQTIVVKDNGNIASPGSQGGSWGNSPPTLTVTGGVYIEDPNNSGTYSATAATAIPQNGGSWTLVYSAQDTTWFTC